MPAQANQQPGQTFSVPAAPSTQQNAPFMQFQTAEELHEFVRQVIAQQQMLQQAPTAAVGGAQQQVHQQATSTTGPGAQQQLPQQLPTVAVGGAQQQATTATVGGVQQQVPMQAPVAQLGVNQQPMPQHIPAMTMAPAPIVTTGAGPNGLPTYRRAASTIAQHLQEVSGTTKKSTMDGLEAMIKRHQTVTFNGTNFARWFMQLIDTLKEFPALVDHEKTLKDVLLGSMSPHDFQEKLRQDQPVPNNLVLETNGVPDPARVMDYTKIVFKLEQERILNIMMRLCSKECAEAIKADLELNGSQIDQQRFGVRVDPLRPERRILWNIPYGNVLNYSAVVAILIMRDNYYNQRPKDGFNDAMENYRWNGGPIAAYFSTIEKFFRFHDLLVKDQLEDEDKVDWVHKTMGFEDGSTGASQSTAYLEYRNLYSNAHNRQSYSHLKSVFLSAKLPKHVGRQQEASWTAPAKNQQPDESAQVNAVAGVKSPSTVATADTRSSDNSDGSNPRYKNKFAKKNGKNKKKKEPKKGGDKQSGNQQRGKQKRDGQAAENDSIVFTGKNHRVIIQSLTKSLGTGEISMVRKPTKNNSGGHDSMDLSKVSTKKLKNFMRGAHHHKNPEAMRRASEECARRGISLKRAALHPPDKTEFSGSNKRVVVRTRQASPGDTITTGNTKPRLRNLGVIPGIVPSTEPYNEEDELDYEPESEEGEVDEGDHPIGMTGGADAATSRSSILSRLGPKVNVEQKKAFEVDELANALKQVSSVMTKGNMHQIMSVLQEEGFRLEEDKMAPLMQALFFTKELPPPTTRREARETVSEALLVVKKWLRQYTEPKTNAADAYRNITSFVLSRTELKPVTVEAAWNMVEEISKDDPKYGAIVADVTPKGTPTKPWDIAEVLSLVFSAIEKERIKIYAEVNALGSGPAGHDGKTLALIDSGAAVHCGPVGLEYRNFTMVDSVRITGFTGNQVEVLGYADYDLILKTKEGLEIVYQMSLVVVADLDHLIVSTGMLEEDGQITYDPQNRRLVAYGKHTIPLRKIGTLTYYVGDFPVKKVSEKRMCALHTELQEAAVKAVFADRRMTTLELHEITGHLFSGRELRSAVKNDLLLGVQLSDNNASECHNCSTCRLVKAKRQKIPDSKPVPIELTSESPYGTISLDTCVHMSFTENGKTVKCPDVTNGFIHFVTCICELTGMIHACGVRELNEVPDAIHTILERIAQSGHAVHTAKTDGGSEYCSAVAEELYRKWGIKHVKTVPKASYQNGKVERAHQTLVIMVQALLVDSELPPDFWYLALQFAVAIRQRLPYRGSKSPLHRLLGEAPTGFWNNIVPFGSDAIIYREGVGKLNPKGIFAVCVGLSADQAGYLLWIPGPRPKLVVQSNVRILKGHPHRVTTRRGDPPQRHRRAPLLPAPRDIVAAPLLRDNDLLRDSGYVRFPLSDLPSPSENKESLVPVSLEEDNPEPRTSGTTGQRRPQYPKAPLPGQSTDVGLSDEELRQRENNFHLLPATRQLSAAEEPVPPSELTARETQPRASPAVRQIPTAPTTGFNKGTPPAVCRKAIEENFHGAVNFKDFEKKGKSKNRYNRYKVAKTPAEAIRLGAKMGDLIWDLQRGNMQAFWDAETVSSVGLGGTIEPEQTEAQLGGPELIIRGNEVDNATKLDMLAMELFKTVWFADPESADNFDFDMAGKEIQDKLINLTQIVKLSSDSDQTVEIEIPENDDQIEKSPYKEKWLAAKNAEFQSFIDLGVARKVPRSTATKQKKRPMNGKWICSLKVDKNGVLLSFKARWVIRGFKQKFSEEFYEVSSPTLKMSTVRMFLAIAANANMNIKYADIKTAYLHAKIDITDGIFTEMPQGYEENDPVTGEPYIWCLNNSVYGTRQAGRNWIRHLTGLLHKLGFTQFGTETCAFYQVHGNDSITVLVYVDDLLIMCTDDRLYENFIFNLRKMIEVKTENISKFLGCVITQDKEAGTVSIDTRILIDKMLEEFDMNLKIPRDPTPAKTNFKMTPGLELIDHENVPGSINPRKFLGFISHMTATVRPDLRIMLKELGQHTGGFNQHDVEAATHLMKYLADTRTLGLTYHREGGLPNKLIAFCDASVTEGNATCGTAILLNGAAIFWSTATVSSIQIAVSDAEAIALKEAADQVSIFRNLMTEFGFSQRELSTPIFCDSQITIANTLTEKNKKGRILTTIRCIKDHIKRGIIHVKYCETKEMIADILTKAVISPKDKYFRLRNIMMGNVLYDYEQEDKSQVIKLFSDIKV